MSMTHEQRIENEKAIVRKMIEILGEDGWKIAKASDGEEVHITDTAEKAMEVAFSVDEAWLYFHKEGKHHSVYMIFGNGNDGFDVIADYSFSEKDDFEQAMEKVAKWINEQEEAGLPLSQDRALQLRIQALALLQEAAALDGLKPFGITHEDKYGSSTYLAWSKQMPDQETAELVLEDEFKPDRGETLSIEETFTLEELTGVSAAGRLDDLVEEQRVTPPRMKM